MQPIEIKPAFVLPRDDQHVSIIGRNGSGKTQAGAWLLSQRSFDRMPWIIVDYKGDPLLQKLNATEIGLSSTPRKPGLYIVKPVPSEQEKVDEFLWRIWKRGRTGIFFDEGYMVTGLESLTAILTQGRSKRLPLIILSQRPVWLDRFVFSEASHIQLFWLQDARDRRTVQSFLPVNVSERLPDYHSTWYDVARDRVFRLLPVPSDTEIIGTFRRRLGAQVRAI